MGQKFIIQAFYVLLFLTGSGLFLKFVIAPATRDENSYLSATIDKQNRLKKLSAPRIVFVGGSNLTFGIDSKRIEDSLKIPVINMGLHAGLGLDYMLAEAQDGLKPDDIVILSTEYYLKNEGSLKLKAALASANPNAIKYVVKNPFDFLRVHCLIFQNYLSGLFYKILAHAGVKKMEHKAYRRSSFNVQGDDIGHLSDSKHYHFSSVTFSGSYDGGVAKLNKFIETGRLKGCKVYYTFPNYPSLFYRQNLKKIKEFEKLLFSQLKCPILNKPETFVYPPDYYFDTAYHLNKKGRALRTDMIIDILKKAINK